MCVCVCVSQLCLTLCNPMDCSPQGSSVPGILQPRILEWVAISSFRGSSQPTDRTRVSALQADALLPEPLWKPRPVGQFSHSVVFDSLWPMDCRTPCLPVYHQFPEFIRTHVHWVCDAIQTSHPLSSPCPPTFNLSQHQGLFKWVSSSHQVVKVLAFQLQHLSFQLIFRTDFL